MSGRVAAFALSPPKKATAEPVQWKTDVNVVIWAAEVQCQVTAKTTHRISWHGSRERQVKTERRMLPECQLGLYMRLRTPWNMCSLCPISYWAALFYCSVINPEICPNCHIFHCWDTYAAAAFTPCIMRFKVIDTSQIKPSLLFRDTDTCQTSRIIQIIARCLQSMSSLPQRGASISFHYVEMPCLYYHFNSAQQQEWSLTCWKGQHRLSVALIFPSIWLHVSKPVRPLPCKWWTRGCYQSIHYDSLFLGQEMMKGLSSSFASSHRAALTCPMMPDFILDVFIFLGCWVVHQKTVEFKQFGIWGATRLIDRP